MHFVFSIFPCCQTYLSLNLPSLLWSNGFLSCYIPRQSDWSPLFKTLFGSVIVPSGWLLYYLPISTFTWHQESLISGYCLLLSLLIHHHPLDFWGFLSCPLPLLIALLQLGKTSASNYKTEFVSNLTRTHQYSFWNFFKVSNLIELTGRMQGETWMEAQQKCSKVEIWRCHF